MQNSTKEILTYLKDLALAGIVGFCVSMIVSHVFRSMASEPIGISAKTPDYVRYQEQTYSGQLQTLMWDALIFTVIAVIVSAIVLWYTRFASILEEQNSLHRE